MVTRARRKATLAAIRARKVAGSAHAFVRASAGFFYETLAGLGGAGVPAGPQIWICGDCHTENVGALSGGGGDAPPSIEINDFDEAVIGEPAHDVLRMALSLAATARTRAFGGEDVRLLVQAMLEGYAAALMRAPADVPSPPRRFRKLLRRASAQTQTALLDHRVPWQAGKRRFAFGDRYWPLGRDERRTLEELLDDTRVLGLLDSLLPGTGVDVSVRDAAFRVAGTGSLGCFRAALLVDDALLEGDRALRLLDVKQGLPGRPPRAAATPRDDAERIVAGARALAPIPGARMIAARLRGTLRDAAIAPGGRGGVVVRELIPQELKANLADLRRDEAAADGSYLGAIIGRAHRRQLGGGDARAWRRVVADPRWLWSVLPRLLGEHERQYLQTCLAG